MTLENAEDVFEREGRILVRALKPEDLEAVIDIDARNTGRHREEYFKIKLQQHMQETGVKVSLAAEVDGLFCGFLLARVFYGEFGRMEPAAVLDTIAVHPRFQGRGIGSAMMKQLHANLTGLGVPRLQTEVSWDDQRLLAFFHREGFRPAQRIPLDLELS